MVSDLEAPDILKYVFKILCCVLWMIFVFTDFLEPQANCGIYWEVQLQCVFYQVVVECCLENCIFCMVCSFAAISNTRD
jgi:hypothetical protein